jgi:DNA polymerase
MARAVPRVPSASELVPEHATLPQLREAAAGCKACHLWERGTQTVFGEGRKSSRVMLVGEQPGNDEDLAGRPFVGPAGRVLDRALEDAGIDRTRVYITNAVKHFKFEERGKRRIHKKPSVGEVRACKPWLEAEFAIVKPTIVGCLGATAAQSILGSEFRLTKDRGRPIEHPPEGTIVATVHPSAILRAPDAEHREAAYAQFVEDLKVIRKLLGS